MAASAGAKIGTAYVDVDADFSKLEQAIKAAMSGANSQFSKIGDTAEKAIKDSMDGAAAEAKKGAAKVGAEGQAAGQTWSERMKGAIGDGVSKVGGLVSDGMSKAKPYMDKAGAAAGIAIAASLVGAISTDAATTKVTAQLGLTAKEGGATGKVMGKLFASNFGDSMADVGEAVKSVEQNIGGLRGTSGKALQDVSGKVLNLSHTFDQDLGGTTNAVGQLMKTGLAKNATEALDLVTKGLQGPANKADDLLDTLNEYPTQFRDMGLSGKDALGLIGQGIAGGARDSDLVADALKEVNIRVKSLDTNAVPALKHLGLNAHDMSEAFAQGGPKAREALSQIFDRLRAVKDPAERAQLSMKLFGTQSEDLAGALGKLDLDTAAKGLGKVSGAADEMGKTLNGSASAEIESFKRGALMSLQDLIATYVLPVIKAVAPAIETIAPVVGPLVVAFAAYAAVVKLAAIAQGLLDAALLANPIGLVITAIVGLVGAVVVLWKKSETFRDIVTGAWDAIKTATTTVWDFLKSYFDLWWKVVSTVFTTYIDAVKLVVTTAWNVIKGATTLVWDAITTYFGLWWAALKLVFTTYIDAVKLVVTTAWDAIKTATTLVWDAIKTAATTIWAAIKTAADLAWEGIRLAVLTPVRVARDLVEGVWTSIHNTAEGAWGGIKSLATSAWNGIKSAVSTPINALEDVISGVWDRVTKTAKKAWDSLTGLVGGKDGFVTKFVTAITDTVGDVVRGVESAIVKLGLAILGVINKIPGVSLDKTIDGLKSDAKSDGLPGFAQGGVVHHGALRGGSKITRPMMVVGEDAPVHPEYIVPTNPAYRGRAQALFAQLGAKIGIPGFAKGGIYSQKEMEALWLKHGGGGGETTTIAGAVGEAESGGNANARNSIGATGLWQIYNGPGTSMALVDPDLNAAAAVAKWHAAGGFSPWTTYTGLDTGPGGGPGPKTYLNFMPGGKGGGGGILDTIAAVVESPLKLAEGIIGKLPKPSDFLPDWMSGTGSYVIDHVTDWIKNKFESIVGGGDVDTLGTSGLGGLTFPRSDTLSIAEHIAKLFHLTISSTYRDPAHNAAVGGVEDSLHTHGSAAAPGATDLVGAYSDMAAASAYAKKYNPIEDLIHDVGSGLHLHLGWFAKGGVMGGDGGSYPFVGSYETGGMIPQTGMALVHQGEVVVPAPLVNAAAAGGATGNLFEGAEILIAVGDGPVERAVVTVVEKRDRAGAAAARAGVR